MLSKEDIVQLNNEGINPLKVEKQIQNFIKGFPYANIVDVATINNGIKLIENSEKRSFISIYDDFAKNNKITKFVPASGAASRMFKNLYGFLGQDISVEKDKFVNYFFNNIEKFAFFGELKKILDKNEIKVSEDNIREIITNLLTEKGLDYGNLPKGLLLFHKYKNEIRTAFAEHLTEAGLYAKSKDKNSDIVFTVSPEHKELFEKLYEKLKQTYEQEYETNFSIEFTEQLSSTNIIAVNLDNTLYKDENGDFLFRPGGHGALIENLNNIKSDLIFIKNIDNVVHEKYLSDTIEYKKIIAGVLIEKKNKIASYLKYIDNNIDKLDEVKTFIVDDLNYNFPESVDVDFEICKSILNRPIRVCGMVKNEGEPGGGPFWVRNVDGSVQLQIVESSEIDKTDSNKMKIMENATHFNPVDIVCSTIDYKGNKFNLSDFVNYNAGFISEKSVNGITIKAQELPGLWNGAMANWNTIFVEVPISTFNPVKTVNDLLRKHHQN